MYRGHYEYTIGDIIVKAATTLLLTTVYAEISFPFKPPSSEPMLGIIEAYDHVAQELYVARENVITRKQMPNLTEIDKYTLKSNILFLELIRTDTALFMFYCLKAETPICEMRDVITKTKTSITVTVDDKTNANFLYLNKIRTRMFTMETSPLNKRYISFTRNVEANTYHTSRNAIALYVLDIDDFSMKLHSCGGAKCVLKIGSPFVLRILQDFYFQRRMYYVARNPGNSVFPAVNVLIQMDLSTGSVVETPLDCIGGSNVKGTAIVPQQGVNEPPLLLTLHRNTSTLEATVCSAELSIVQTYFSEILNGNKTTSNYRVCTHGHCVFSGSTDKTRFHLDAELASAMFQKFLDKRQEAAVYIDNKYAEEHAATTLFMSKATPFFHTNAEAVSLSVTRHEDYFLAHVLTKDSEITTVKLGNNSQVVSVTKITNEGKETSNDISQSLVSYDNTLYVCDDQTIHVVDVSQCERHLVQDTCLRDVVDCSWCNNTIADVSVSSDVTTAAGVNSSHCSTTSECLSPVSVYMGLQPQVSKVQPTWGPKSGGNIIEVIGDQIDMAQNVTVTIAGNTCRILQVSIVRNSLHCVVPGYDGHVQAPSKVHVQLDGVRHVLEYQYMEDPVITGVFPKRTITSLLQQWYQPVEEMDRRYVEPDFDIHEQQCYNPFYLGGIRINITGDYVANRNWSNLYLVFANPNATYTSRHFPCDLTQTGVSCITPPIRGSFENTIQRMHLSLGLSGSPSLEEGYLHTQPIELQVLPDPVVQNFVAKMLNPSQETVIFEGTNLNDVEMSEISVEDLYLKEIFIVTNVTSTDIHCRLKKPTDSRLFLKVMIGEHLVFYPGVAVQSRITAMAPSTSTDSSSSPSSSSGSDSSQINSDPGKNQEEPGTSKDFTVAIVVPVICACVVLALVVGLAVKARRRKRRLNHQRPSIVSYSGSMGVVIGERSVTRNLSNASISDVRLTDDTDDIAKEIIRRLEEEGLIIKRTHLKMQKLIGRGNFGSVFKGIFQEGKDTREVAVKTLHQDEPRDLDIQLFLKEAYVMRDFRHPNVMTLVGICLDLDEMPLVIIPYMEHGDLLTYLHEDKHIPTVKDLVSYGLDIARGMTYLAQLKFVHRDLAARNCMLDSNYTVKVADFGLSRDIYESSYYSARSKGTKLPVKWMAIDSLTNGVFNEKTDVWSYGVTLWELMTRGVRPYATVDNWDMERYLQSGRRLPQPMYCPNQLYRVMRKCWMESPDGRPLFDELQEWISEMLARVHHQLGNADRATNIQTTYVNLSMGASYHYENTANFHND